MLGRCSMGTDDGRAGQLSNAAHRPPRQPKIMLHFSRENAERMKILSYQRYVSSDIYRCRLLKYVRTLVAFHEKNVEVREAATTRGFEVIESHFEDTSMMHRQRRRFN